MFLYRTPLGVCFCELHFIPSLTEILTNIYHNTCTSDHNKCHQGVQVYYRRQTTKRGWNSTCFDNLLRKILRIKKSCLVPFYTMRIHDAIADLLVIYVKFFIHEMLPDDADICLDLPYHTEINLHNFEKECNNLKFT